MYININTRGKKSRISRNLQLVHSHPTDLQSHFSQKRSLKQRNVILLFRLMFAGRITTRALVLCFLRHHVY